MKGLDEAPFDAAAAKRDSVPGASGARLHEQIKAVLARYMSPITAQSVIFRVARQGRTSPEKLEAMSRPALLAALGGGVRLFVDEDQRNRALHELRQIVPGSQSSLLPEVIEIRSEADIVGARSTARRLCVALGANPLQVQRVATIVSELARNILLYVGEGRVTLTPVASAPRRFKVQARDNGSGIPNLDEILAGRYVSKTGMGKGLLGTQRLADHFHITTAQTGTFVEAEVRL